MKSKMEKALSVAQQQKLAVEEADRFIHEAKKTGESLSVREIDESLPKRLTAPQALDIFVQSLEAQGIVIQEHIAEDGRRTASFLEEAGEDGEKEEEVSEGEQKSNDPVRLYLRKMGSVSLLTREGEVQIAQRIEAGERQIVRAILTSPVGTREIIQLGDRVSQGKLKVKAIFRGLEDEQTQYKEQEYIDKIYELIGEVKKYEKKVKNILKSFYARTSVKTKDKKFSSVWTRILKTL